MASTSCCSVCSSGKKYGSGFRDCGVDELDEDDEVAEVILDSSLLMSMRAIVLPGECISILRGEEGHTVNQNRYPSSDAGQLEGSHGLECCTIPY